MRLVPIAALALAALLPATAPGGDVTVVAAEAAQSGGSWRFDVTLEHGDTGWDHYADAWRVVGPDGTVYGTRTLYHPHVEEQPFTRSLSGIAIPDEVTQIRIEAHDSVHGWSPQVFERPLPR